MFNGRYIRLEGYEDLIIESGTQGNYRNDLIVIRYTKDTTANTESAKLVVIKGTANSTTASDPEHVSGNILEGAAQSDMPLYRIPLDNVNIGVPVALFEIIEDNVGNMSGKQNDTKNLTATTALADGDYFPFYDVSANGNRKTLWSNIIAKIKTAIWGTTSGFVKANGSGGISGVSTIPIANGGTGATTAASARTNLGVAAVGHTHTAADVGAAEIDSDGKVAASQTSSALVGITEDTTLGASHCGKFLRVSSSSGTITITIPDSNALPNESEIEILRYGAGDVTITAAAAIGLRGIGSTTTAEKYKITDRYGVAVLKRIGTATWILSGAVEKV